ncbi:uncharacterized protein EAF01_008400 [Botrytis porri]|uniref:uncharacterized protein n=1 Tax=Botrytis porri TaxID=87229 RepID=UPI0019003659|nr:uncharacterized protein EAF01_008400 [Botrytis porri]KAF7899187.1 hypothetical protein EAF01_008400 [Botrytis porri]
MHKTAEIKNKNVLAINQRNSCAKHNRECSYTPLKSRGRKKKRPRLDLDPLDEAQDPGLRDGRTASPTVIRPETHRPLAIDNNGPLAVKRRRELRSSGIEVCQTGSGAFNTMDRHPIWPYFKAFTSVFIAPKIQAMTD